MTLAPSKSKMKKNPETLQIEDEKVRRETRLDVLIAYHVVTWTME